VSARRLVAQAEAGAAIILQLRQLVFCKWDTRESPLNADEIDIHDADSAAPAAGTPQPQPPEPRPMPPPPVPVPEPSPDPGPPNPIPPLEPNPRRESKWPRSVRGPSVCVARSIVARSPGTLTKLHLRRNAATKNGREGRTP
jgi:hypothetical protein